jgi:hypothetical protein
MPTIRNQPRPGEFVVGCVHKPRLGGSHWYYVDPPLVLRDTECLVRTAHWVIVCTACVRSHAHPHEIPLGCGRDWPEGMPPIEFDPVQARN